MAKSLKDQLLSKGFRTAKMENHREIAKGREQKQSEKHQVTRNFCEHCSLIHPDVERYKHRMPTTEAEWICLACADKLMIDDRFRVTHQSDMAKRKMFKRFFGTTKDPSEFKNDSFKKKPSGPQQKDRFDKTKKNYPKKPHHRGDNKGNS